MKSFEIVTFDDDMKHSMSMKCGLRKNFTGTREETEEYVRKVSEKHTVSKIYYVNWKYDGYPAGFLVVKK